MAKKKFNLHADWIRLLETNLPVFNSGVLQEAYPQGFPVPSYDAVHRLRWDYEDWRDFHRSIQYREKLNVLTVQDIDDEWVSSVTSSILNWSDKSLTPCSKVWPGVQFPDCRSASCLCHRGTAKLFFVQFAYYTTPNYLSKATGRIESPIEELVSQAKKLNGAPRMALVTNGECWTLVTWLEDCPITFATWYAQDWRREPQLLNAFAALLSFNSVCKPKNGLYDLLTDSTKSKDNVTDTLGEQVQRAIEVLVQSLDKADSAGSSGILEKIGEKSLYEASLTVMMRLVFILCAEGRRLLPFGEAFYDENYAISNLRQTLQDQADFIGEGVLENRFDAWGRFIALCRVIHDGCEHEDMRLAALGGSLFDSQRYPFFDGGSIGQQTLPVDNRTFLYLLEALQVIDCPGGAEFVSYGAIDVEQIGHIYEGLLELQIKRTDGVTLRLKANKNASKTEWLLSELESLFLDGQSDLIEALTKKDSGINVAVSRIKTQLEAEIPETLWTGLLKACDGNDELALRIKPFVNLVQIDAWGRPIVYQDRAFMVARGTSRRESGAYYTPRSLTECIVKTTLDPLIYKGMAEGKPPIEWRMKSPSEILSLKICDPAMGSGAFLVQACRYLSEKLVLAWRKAEEKGKRITADGSVVDNLGSLDPMSDVAEDRFVEARRLVSERCLYGVDKNPMAVELAKLSIWLVTLSKGRPFGFLDHCLGCGDSLLGIANIDDIFELGRQAGLFGSQIEQSVKDASRIRQEIESELILDIHDVESQQLKLRKAADLIEPVELLADVLLLENLKATKSNKKSKQTLVGLLALTAAGAIQRSPEATSRLKESREGLWKDLQGEAISTFNPFHYALRFPEVFEKGGFDAVVGNPPFMGRGLWKSTVGQVAGLTAKVILGVQPGRIDMSVVFHRRAFDLLHSSGCYGLLGVTNISESEAVKVGLATIVKQGTIYSAVKSLKWPGSANINVAIVHICKGAWKGEINLNGQATDTIYPNLTNETFGEPKKITSLIDGTQGVNTVFINILFLDPKSERAIKILKQSKNILVPIVNGQTIGKTSLEKIDNYVINSGDKSLEDIRNESVDAYEFLMSVREKRLRKIREKGDTYKGWDEQWWKHWNTRADFFNRYPQSERLLYSILTKYPLPRRVSNILTTHKALIFPIVFDGQPPLFLSSAMQIWLSTFTGAKKGDNAVEISLVLSSFRNFPCPNVDLSEESQKWAIEFDNYLRDQGGITPAMNRFHDSTDNASEVVRARELQRLIDEVVIKAYGWDDLDLTYEFADRGIGERYGLKEETRKELLRRLVKLNNEYWEEQQKQAGTGSVNQ